MIRLKFTLLAPLVFLFAVGARMGYAIEFLADIDLKDVEIVQTSGTLTLQTFRADRATVTEGGATIDAWGITLSVTKDQDKEPINVSSPFARYYLLGEAADPGKPMSMPSSEDILDWNEQMKRSKDGIGVDEPFYGDFILADPEYQTDVALTFPPSGRLESPALYWNSSRQVFASLPRRMEGPSGFTQDVRSESGTRVRISGPAFATDAAFQEWVYFPMDNEKVSMEFEGGATR